jgi:hypothetical protein
MTSCACHGAVLKLMDHSVHACTHVKCPAAYRACAIVTILGRRSKEIDNPATDKEPATDGKPATDGWLMKHRPLMLRK